MLQHTISHIALHCIALIHSTPDPTHPNLRYPHCTFIFTISQFMTGDLGQQGDGGTVVRVRLHGGQPQVGAEQRRARVLRLLGCHAPAPAPAAAVGHCVAVIFVKLVTKQRSGAASVTNYSKHSQTSFILTTICRPIFVPVYIIYIFVYI